MNTLYLLCIDDQPEILHALENDLAEFEEHLTVEVCESGKEALEVMDEIDKEGDYLAVILSDQVMPGLSGVDVLAQIEKDGRFPHTQKGLLTGLATHQDTIEAINSAGLDFYLQKPWSKEELVATIKKYLTIYVLAMGLEYSDYMPILDQHTLYETLRKQS